jgi:peptidase E
MMSFIDMCIKEKSDNYRPLNCVIHQMVSHVQNGHPAGARREALRFIQAIYFQDFKQTSVWSLLTSPHVVAVAGVPEIEGSLEKLLCAS